MNFRSRIIRLWFAGLGILLLSTAAISWGTTPIAALGSSPTSSPITIANPPLFSEDLNHFAQHLVQHLSQKKPFTEWSSATLIIEALGPGTHAWLVTVGTSGYLIIGAKEEGGYALIEYGKGTVPIFGRNQLEQALSNFRLQTSHCKIEKIYAGPTLIQCRITQIGTNSMRKISYLDAFSGELLPETEISLHRQMVPFLVTSHAVSSLSLQVPLSNEFTANAFNPYDNMLWLKNKPLQHAPGAMPAQLTQKKQLVFVSQGGTRTYSTSLPINGLQRWTSSTYPQDAVYLISQSETSARWISLSALEASGQFYDTNS